VLKLNFSIQISNTAKTSITINSSISYSLDEIRDIFGNEEIESKIAKKIKAV